MTEHSEKQNENRILTIPNLLSAFRICLIPCIVWAYLVKERNDWAVGLLIVSGLTDMCDGFIARKFHMISNLGKILDPVADKLTQGVTLLCLIKKIPAMLALCVLLIVKEVFLGITGLLAIRKSGKVNGAVWHGKVVTWLLYLTMILHMIWVDIPKSFSLLLIVVCFIMMVISFFLYGRSNLRQLKEA